MTEENKIHQAAKVLANLPDSWFDKQVLCSIRNAEEQSDKDLQRAGAGWKVQCRERFRSVMRAIATEEKPDE